METTHAKDEWDLADIPAGRYIKLIHEVGNSVLHVMRQSEHPIVSVKRVPSGLTEGEPMQLLGSIDYQDIPIVNKDIIDGKLVAGTYTVLGEAMVYLAEDKTRTSFRPRIFTLDNTTHQIEVSKRA